MSVLASRVGIRNLPAFTGCMQAAVRESRNRQPALAVANLQIAGTPTVIVRGKLVRGALPAAHLLRLLNNRDKRDD